MCSLRRLSFFAMGLALLFAACGPAATATPAPARAAPPTATATPKPTVAPSIAATATPASQPTATSTRPAVAQPKYGGTLKIVRRAEDPAWDFMKYTGGGGNLRPMAHMVFSMLASRASAEPKPCDTGLNRELAESWKWVNDTTFEVKIRQGVKFQNKPPVNGREVTAEDVAYSYRRGFFTWPIRGIAVVADSVQEIVATDRYTVQFHTKTPLGLLPENMATNYSLVILARESGGTKELWEDPATSWIGSGPFMFEGYQAGLKVSLVRNPDYFEKGFPYIERVEHLIVPDKSTIEAGMRAGRLDLWDWDVGQLSVEAIRRTNPEIRVQECLDSVGTTGGGWLYFKWDEPLWKDIRVRRAAMLAIDRQSIGEKALLGRGVPMSPWPPVLPVFTKKEDLTPEAQRLLTYNPQEARRLLAEAGYTGDKAPELNLVSTTRYGLVGPFAATTEMLQKMLTDVGFKVKVDWQDSARYMAGFIPGVWAPGSNAGVGLWSVSPSAVLTKFHCKASKADNKAGVCDPEYDALVDRWMATTDPNKSWELAKAIQSRIVEQAYGIPTVGGFEFALWQPWLKNNVYINVYYPRPITYAWLDR